jgi:hypothetical protein
MVVRLADGNDWQTSVRGRAAALAADGIEARLAGQTVRKFVYVPGQVVNLVVG